MADLFTWENLIKLLESFGVRLAGYIPNLFGSILVLVVGWWLVNRIERLTRVMLKRRKVEQTMRDFFATMISYGLRVILITSVVTMIGIETASVLAFLTSVGVAIGLALSGTLQNFAGGLLILVMRHIKVGDEIEAQGHQGIVERIELFYTIVTTFANEKVILPNGPLSTQVVRNNTGNAFRRMEFRLRVEIGYDVSEMRDVLHEKMASDERTLQDPAPFVIIDEVMNDAIIVSARAYVLGDDYWLALWDIREDIYNTFANTPEVYPYPKMDIARREAIKKDGLDS